MTGPTVKQQRALDLYEELGTVKAVAQALGTTSPNVSQLLATGRLAIARQEAETLSAASMVTARLDRIEAKLDELLARPATAQVIEWRPDHRRIVDGGRQVRKQRREMRERAG